MSDDANSNGEQSLGEEAHKAILAYLRWAEESGRTDLSEFLHEKSEFVPWEDVLRDHGNDVARLWPQLTQTAPGLEFPANTALDPSMPTEVVFATQIGEIQHHEAGGLGVVCSGNDDLGRRVAVKFIRPEKEMQSASRDDFLLEREITGRLEHPGVVPVHGFGQTDDGKLFCVMQFLQGVTLDEEIEKYHGEALRTPGERVVLFRKLLAHFVSICRTIGYAHSRGILHRDIKPKNVILGKYGETFVVDWGLAIPIPAETENRVDDEATIKPESGGSPTNGGGAGTYAYMPPEALTGGELSAAADVYSLGASLYHLLCGRPPTRPAAEENKEDVVRRIVAQDFPHPRAVCEDISADLEAVCLKAMEYSPRERYVNPMELARDIEQFLADEPVSVLPDSITRRMARWRRHHPAAVQVGLLSLLLMLAVAATGALVSWRWYTEAERQREAAVAHETSTLLRSAELAAVRWATDMSLRWRILRHWADDPHLHQGIERLTELDDEQVKTAEDVQQWLDRQVANNDLDDITVTNWYVNDVNGRLLARYKDKPELRGERFDFRSYFHGEPNDKPPRGQPYPPLAVPGLSAIFKSVGAHVFRVALSVPVQDKEETIGVLTMTIDLHRFDDADLIDMRENNFGGMESPLQGIYLKQKKIHAKDGKPSELERVEATLLQRISGELATSKGAFWFHDYESPVNRGAHPAAFAPVLVNGVWTGLVAVVEQLGNEPSTP